MIRILFVDDEPHVLEGLRRSMRSMRAEWETRFSLSGADALQELARWQADVVVTDLQMPGMGGVQLLNEIRRLYPKTIRFVLSGHAEPSAVIQAAATAHQYMAKPCDAKVLKGAVGRAQALREVLNDPRIAVWAGSAGALPSLPEAFRRITACLQDNAASISDVAEVIKGDLAVSTMLLKLANSAFFGSGQAVRTVERAASFLGVDIVASMVLASGVFKASTHAGQNLDLAALWQHSVQTAAVARDLALYEKWPSARVDDAFLAGMLHDLGHLVMATSAAATNRAAPNDMDHAQVGAYLVGLWGFPDELVEAIAFHHRPSRASPSDVSLAALVHAANLLAHHVPEESGEVINPDMDDDFFNRAGMLERWRLWQGCISRAGSVAGEVA